MSKALSLLVALPLLASASAAAAGCQPDTCVPRTGNWIAPSPQHLTSPFGPTNLTLTVSYRRNDNKVKSKYGNTLESFGVYLRYFCDSDTNPWVETGFATTKPIAIDKQGVVKVTVPAGYAGGAHRLSLTFKRTTFKGRLSGTATSSEGNVCSTSVSFAGRLKG
jgi:hypothetical protein